jgi:hypothetical protein
VSKQRRTKSRKVNRVCGYLTVVVAGAGLALIVLDGDYAGTTWGVPSWLLAVATIGVGIWLILRPPSF